MIAKIWIAERDWGDGRVDFLGAGIDTDACLTICAEAEKSMPRSELPLVFEKSDDFDSYECHISKSYSYRFFETTIEGSQPDPMFNHKCKMIGKAHQCDEGREFWIGELLEPIEGYPAETHCIHIKTPAKSVVFGVNLGDATILAIAAQLLHKEMTGVDKPINQRWLDLQEEHFRMNTKGTLQDAQTETE